jgi:hypothetical protein
VCAFGHDFVCEMGDGGVHLMERREDCVAKASRRFLIVKMEGARGRCSCLPDMTAASQGGVSERMRGRCAESAGLMCLA